MARELKYHTQDTDFSALQRELGQSSQSTYRGRESDNDPYAEDGYDEDSWATGSR